MWSHGNIYSYVYSGYNNTKQITVNQMDQRKQLHRMRKSYLDEFGHELPIQYQKRSAPTETSEEINDELMEFCT